jgi:tetratricopeptide (TPR) repeat protein
MTDDPGGASPATATRDVPWWSAAMHECRMLLFAADFPRALAVAERATARARSEDDGRAWRRFTNQRALALNGACRFEEALALCDAVIASIPEAEDRGAVAQAWNTGAAAAQRLARDDTLRRLDSALAIGEWYVDEQGRFDSLARTAATAASLGLAELGDSVYGRVVADIDDGAAGRLSPSSIMWIKAQGITVRLWWAMSLDFRGDPRAASVYEGTVELIRAVLAELPAGPGLVGTAATVLRAFEGHILVRLGRTAEAREPLAHAATTLPTSSPDVFSAAIEIACGLSSLRLGTVRGPEAAAVAAQVVRVAQRSGDMWAEADAWRLAAVAAGAHGDRLAHAVAQSRFEALVDRLDWRRRLQSAELLAFRSRTLRRIVEGEDWLRPPG